MVDKFYDVLQEPSIPLGAGPLGFSKFSLLVGKPGAQDRNRDFLQLVNALCALYLEGAENIGSVR